MIERRRDGRLESEACPRVGVVQQRAVQQFHGHRPIQSAVPSGVHNGHAAVTEHATKFVAAAEEIWARHRSHASGATGRRQTSGQ
ncbi:hypothetical protein GCM10023114_07570 [Mycolicibacterium sediminis]